MAERKQSVISNQNLGVLGHLMNLSRFTSLPASKLDWGSGERNEVKPHQQLPKLFSIYALMLSGHDLKGS